MNADFNQQLEEIRQGKVEVLRLRLGCRNIGVDGTRSLSTALMNENNKVIRLELSENKIGDDGEMLYQLR